MRCEAAERELSARLDGARDARLDDRLESHVASCERCRSFEAGSRELRRLVRLAPAPAVPDLAPEIMASIAREPRGRRRVTGALVRRLPAPRTVAAFVAGAAASALVLGALPVVGPRTPAAVGAEVPDLVARAAIRVRAYTATFDVRERHFHELVDDRRMEATVAFRAPERFSARIRDRTRYPSKAWPRNDITLSVDSARWAVHGPASCPREALPACATTEPDVRNVDGREPFDADSVLPSDIVVPVRTLAGSERVEVRGYATVLGRRVVLVELAYRDAAPLFAYLHASGSWRPAFPLDRVRVALDTTTWFPLAYDVRASHSLERAAWAARSGLATERPGELLLRVSARAFRTDVDGSDFEDVRTERAARRGGFVDAPASDALRPSDLQGLSRYRSGHLDGGGRPDDEVLTSYTDGVSWLKVRETRRWTEPTLFGNIGPLAEPVSIPGGGVAYYEPATATLGRRLSVHARDADLFLETTLSRESLLAVAASLPVRGEAAPREWLVRAWPGGIVREQVSLPDARRALPGLLDAGELPSGYRLGPVFVVRSSDGLAVTTYYRRPGTEMDGVGIRLHQAAGAPLAPPLSPDVITVRLRGTTARYSSERGELEWVEAGIYRSLTAGGLDLASLAALAGALTG